VTAPRFAAGARVQVRPARPEISAPMHLRTPHYVRGRQGAVQRVLGTFANPEALAFGRKGEPRVLYHVLFDQSPIWNEGETGDTVLIEIFEHWLEAA
jgi:nitrile hydratase subunit beta